MRLAFAFNDFTYMDQQLVRWQALRHSKVDGMAVYSKDAVMLATGRSNRMLVGTSGSINDATIQRVAATGLAARGTPLRSCTTGHPIMPIHVPVRSEAGQIVGVFAETLALESLADSLAKLHFTAHSRVSVTDNVSGLILVSDDRDKVLTTQSSGKNATAKCRWMS